MSTSNPGDAVTDRPVDPQAPDSPPQELLIKGVRTAPKFSSFIGVGVLAGLILAVALTFVQRTGPEYNHTQVFGYLAVGLGLIGGLLGGLVAIILDRR